MRVEIFIKHSEGAFRKGGPFAVVKIRVEHHILFVIYYESRGFIQGKYVQKKVCKHAQRYRLSI